MRIFAITLALVSAQAVASPECPLLNGSGLKTTRFTVPANQKIQRESASVKTLEDAAGVTTYKFSIKVMEKWYDEPPLIADGVKKTGIGGINGFRQVWEYTATCSGGTTIHLEWSQTTHKDGKFWDSSHDVIVYTKTATGYRYEFKGEREGYGDSNSRVVGTSEIVFRN